MRRPKRKAARPTSLTGSAGVHFVCAELCMHGLIALPTIRNTKGMDVVVLTQDGTFVANVQVKTLQKRFHFGPSVNIIRIGMVRMITMSSCAMLIMKNLKHFLSPLIVL